MDFLRRSKSSIVAKLHLLILLILLSVAGTVTANLLVSHQVRNAVNALIDEDISRMIRNTELSRNLDAVFAETHLLLGSFIEQEEVLKREGQRLLAILQHSAVEHEKNAIHDALAQFQQTLTTLLDQCAVIIQITARLHSFEQELETSISQLDEMVMELTIERKLEGKDYELFSLEQIAASLPDYHSLLLQIAMQLDQARQDYLSAIPVPKTSELQTQLFLNDLTAGFMTIMTAGDEFQPSGTHLLAAVKAYGAEIAQFHGEMRRFQAQLRDLNDAQARVVDEMKMIEGEIEQTSVRIRGSVAEQLRSSGNVTIFFSIIVILALAVVGVYAFKSIRPILHLTTSAMAIANGELDANIDLEGRDEIGRLAQSFAQMRDVVRAEMLALEEKNSALQQETTERKRAEDALRLLNDHLEHRVSQRTADLQAANTELQEFAYVVSHDLKAPLRGICHLAQWLREDYAEMLGEQGGEQLRLLVEQTKRMEQLIDGILRYSKAVHRSEHQDTVDSNALVAQVIDSLMPPPHISIQFANQLPVLYGDPVRLTQVFQNLLSNALKFMDKPEGRIAIGCEDSAEMWIFYVEDNGRGIESQHYERIFKIFQTLSPVENHESTGIGLTVVKKIVELYGGRIWVESTEGEGSRFYFTWPKTYVNTAE